MFDADANRLIGFANGYVIGQNVRNHFIKAHFPRLLLKGVSLLLRGDSAAWKKVLSRLNKGVSSADSCATKVQDGEGDLLSICVLPEYRGSGAAAPLINQFEEGLAERSIYTYYLSVYKTNDRAKAFYEKMGFQVFHEGGDSIKYKKTVFQSEQRTIKLVGNGAYKRL